jgi:predicted nuclease of predicted toxin-antitoxin system
LIRFLVDECTGPGVAAWLRQQQYEVFSVYEQARGSDDDTLIQKAFSENWVLITNDKDFGEMVYRERRSHRGVVFLRLSDERAVVKIAVLQALLESYAERLPDNFVVVTESRVRFAGSPNP